MENKTEIQGRFLLCGIFIGVARVHCLSITSSVATIVKQCLSVPIKILKNYKLFCTLNTLIWTFLFSMITLEKIKLFPTLTELTSPGSNLHHWDVHIVAWYTLDHVLVAPCHYVTEVLIVHNHVDEVHTVPAWHPVI